MSDRRAKLEDLYKLLGKDAGTNPPTSISTASRLNATSSQKESKIGQPSQAKENNVIADFIINFLKQKSKFIYIYFITFQVSAAVIAKQAAVVANTLPLSCKLRAFY